MKHCFPDIYSSVISSLENLQFQVETQAFVVINQFNMAITFVYPFGIRFVLHTKFKIKTEIQSQRISTRPEWR